MMDRAERDWLNCLDTTTRLKFEALREKYHFEMQALMKEIREERAFRKEQCCKVFD